MLLPHFVIFLGASFYATAEKEHGIVYPRLLTARGESGQKVLKINDNIALSLEKSKVFSGDFLLYSEENGEPIHYYMKEDDYEKICTTMRNIRPHCWLTLMMAFKLKGLLAIRFASSRCRRWLGLTKATSLIRSMK
uniref:Putative tick metalloprotease 19 n=1 Tax=Amblyomma cajennense TaxID=34607 RepID=A0A023FBY9_AMBCJ